MPLRRYVDVACVHIYKRYIVFNKVCRGTKQRQHHRDISIASIFSL